jgi:hypothetical protein
MAVSGVGGLSTGTFTTYTSMSKPVDESVYEVKQNGHILHRIDLRYNKVDPSDYIKWCRRNLGNRNETWDFWLAGGILYVEVWGDKAKVTYEMWKH